MKLRAGSRGSKLSLVQTDLVLDLLKKTVPELEFEVVTIRTKGDVDARPLYRIDQKGIFEKEIDAAVLSKKIDFAVHSLKDIPSALPEGLTIASIPKRESPNDIFVNDRKMKLAEIPGNSVIGTSSLRRAVQVNRLRPDLQVKPIRGNVETRVNKMLRREFDAVVLAEAGISRLGMRDVIAERLPTDNFTPSPGQGAMAIVCREDDPKLIDVLRKIEDKRSRTEVTAERALLLRINAGCRFPLGAIATANTTKLALHANVYSADGKQRIDVKKTDSLANAEHLGMQVAAELEQKGAMKLAEDWRDAVENWSDTGK
ncbi:MAG: hydroxymethylbilane synthase [Nitrososphaerales archaeon]